MIETTAKISIINGKVLITPDDNYDEIEKFFWENREKTLNEIDIIPF